MSDKSYIITKETQKRLISDIKDIVNNPLTDQGIMYVHDETNLLRGYAMLIGPSETIYEDGIYFFVFEFPHDYPYSPPKLLFKTYDGKTRFHPNLYRNGKVCLSILNTWRGEQWTSCQTIHSILLTLITLFNNKPLLNEPGVLETHRDFVGYNKIIKYRNYEISILQMISHEKIPPVFSPFYAYIKQHFGKKQEDILKRLEKESSNKKITVKTQLYNMCCEIDYKIIHRKMKELCQNFLIKN